MDPENKRALKFYGSLGAICASAIIGATSIINNENPAREEYLPEPPTAEVIDTNNPPVLPTNATLFPAYTNQVRYPSELIPDTSNNQSYSIELILLAKIHYEKRSTNE